MKLTALGMAAILGDLIAVGGYFDPATTWVGVATAVTDHGPATAMADVTEAVGGPLTRVHVVAWSAPYPLADGRWAVDGPIASFAAGGGDPAQILSHWFLATLAVAGVLKGWGTFNPAISVAPGSAPANLVVRLTIDPSGRWDANVQWNG